MRGGISNIALQMCQ